MDNVQNCDSYINIPSPQTYRCYRKSRLLNFVVYYFVQLSLFFKYLHRILLTNRLGTVVPLFKIVHSSKPFAFISFFHQH
jgi:hypothetical protein